MIMHQLGFNCIKAVHGYCLIYIIFFVLLFITFWNVTLCTTLQCLLHFIYALGLVWSECISFNNEVQKIRVDFSESQGLP